MSAVRIAIVVALAVAIPTGGPAFGHGASKGLHLHVEPDRAEPGDEVTVSIDASRPLTSVRIGTTADDATVTVSPDPPARRLEATIEIPDTAAGSINVHAEARTVDGTTVRTAAVVTVVERSEEPAPADFVGS